MCILKNNSTWKKATGHGSLNTLKESTEKFLEKSVNNLLTQHQLKTS